METTIMERNINSLFYFLVCFCCMKCGEEERQEKEKRRKGHRACRLWRLTLPRVPVSVVCLFISNNDGVLLCDIENE